MADSTEDYTDPERSGLTWKGELDRAKDTFKTWWDRGDQVIKRYRDERDATERLRTKFNILWSNVELLKPALYGRPAKPEVSRRFLNSDPVARMASVLLENVLAYEVKQFPDFEVGMESAVEDRLLPGRGIVWLSWNPNMNPGAQVDYVDFKDFLHSPARRWNEVWWVSRYVYLTRDEGVERFGDVFENVPLQDVPASSGKKAPNTTRTEYFEQKAKVAEIWNKRDGTVCWLADGYNQLLDERDAKEVMDLEGFFPCPAPLYATMTNGTLIPVPDYTEYQDQASELDTITARISNMVKGIMIRGVYNAEYKELGRLLSDGTDNKLVPIANWAGLAEKGGLESAVDLLNLDTQIKALSVLYNARDTIIQTIYQITGISDIFRGSTKAEETLGAQQLKAQFGSMRLKETQADVARFASDIFRMKAEIICASYEVADIVAASGIMETEEGRANPQIVIQAVQLLKSAKMRDFRIDVESDSLAQIDDAEEKQAATEAIAAIGGFVKEALPMVEAAPESLPMVRSLLMALVRRFRFGRESEAAIEQTFNALGQKVANPQPSKEQIEAQMQAQADQMRMQSEAQLAQMKAQMDSQTQQTKLATEAQLEKMKASQEQALEKMKSQVEMYGMALEDDRLRWIEELRAATQIQVAEIGAKSRAEASDKQLEGTLAKKGVPKPDGRVDEIGNRTLQIGTDVAELGARLRAMLHAASAPRDILRDPEGRIKAVVPRPMDPAPDDGNLDIAQLEAMFRAASAPKDVVRDEQGRIKAVMPRMAGVN